MQRQNRVEDRREVIQHSMAWNSSAFLMPDKLLLFSSGAFVAELNRNAGEELGKTQIPFWHILVHSEQTPKWTMARVQVILNQFYWSYHGDTPSVYYWDHFQLFIVFLLTLSQTIKLLIHVPLHAWMHLESDYCEESMKIVWDLWTSHCSPCQI